MNRKVKLLVFALVATVAVMGTTLATLLLNYPITTNIIIKPKFSMGVFDVDGTTPLTAIGLGQFEWNSKFFFPGHSETEPSQHYFVKNTDQMSFYVAFCLPDIPDGTDWKFWIKRGDEATWFTFSCSGPDPSPHPYYSLAIQSSVVDPNPLTQFAEFYFSLEVLQPPFGTYAPTIHVYAADSVLG